MIERKIIYTKRKYLQPVKCLTDGVVYDDIKKLCSVVYGMEFKSYNLVGEAIEKGRRVKGNFYSFVF